MDKPVLPDYAGACISNIVPALLDGAVEPPPWIPSAAIDTGVLRLGSETRLPEPVEV